MKNKWLMLWAALAPTCFAAWDDSYDPMSGSIYTSDPVSSYEDVLGVDPIYSTPSSSTSAGFRQRAFVPDCAYVEYMGKMSISAQSARTQVMNAFISLPLTSAALHSWGKWHWDTRLSGRMTWINTDGDDVIGEDTLYTVGFQAALSYRVTCNSQFTLAFTPQISSDLDVMTSQIFFWGGYAAFSSRVSDRLSYTAGLAFMPDYYEHYVFPLINLSWQCAPVWQLQIQASRLSVVNVAHENFHWGPFIQWNAGIWTVQRQGHTQQLRMTNCIAGLSTSYDCHLQGGTVLRFVGDLGTAFYSTFRVRDKRGDHTLEKYRTHPGWYMRLGVQVQF